MTYLVFSLSGWKSRMMVENSDINSFRNCCFCNQQLLSDQAVPPQPAFIPICPGWPVHVSSTRGCRWHAGLQISDSRTLKTSCLLPVQKDVMVKVNIPPAHAWWESVILSHHPWLTEVSLGQLLLELKVSLKAWHTFHQGSLLSKTHWP